MPHCATHRPICLRALGSFHIGGRQVQLSGQPSFEQIMSEGGQPVKIDLNGTYVVEQMYVQYFLPHAPNGKGPLVLWHGGAMTGAAWETTPDGRDGWLNYFLQQGWDVYLCDAVERGRSGFAPTPTIWPAPPIIQTADDVYTRFRIGYGPGSYHTDPALRRPYPNTRFPVNHFDQFCKQMVPRWTHTNAAMIAAFQALLERIGPASIVCHSQSGPLALKLAWQHPHLVRSLVAIEPAGIPHERSPLSALPTLIVLGGNIAADDRWSILAAQIQAFIDCHANASLLWLEKQGIEGNSHVMMLDNNSDDIAGMVHEWLAART
ncbi:alpha/beta fold hydrolase [Pusillimonas sp. TS35]|uniref:alpha/beta fold hydrolase n=1 Tax=Paracandidimonas lactea TaxID=2895524 RepID=UPI001367C7FE|nr:alpha/beta fold hydrolase [Paracandidimonas lactea]MYN13961.1 alpha/beta fold hydrolase [Pusillimonas sp. TS35]